MAIVRTLQAQGHVAYLAGGCVRDRMLGLVPKDHDVATDATPERVRQLFPRSQAVGAAFGVVLVYTGKGEHLIATEVATFRKDAAYTDGRRPDAVTFTDAPTDAQRRDFTVNGLFELPGGEGLRGLGDEGLREEGERSKDAMQLSRDHALGSSASLSPLAPQPLGPLLHPFPDGSLVLDYVGGLRDLELRLLRAIGDPDERFGEDYLRMLRAVRFAARLGFAIEDRTAKAIRNAARYLGQISRERIGAEVMAMLTGPTPALAAALLQRLRLDGPTLNEEHVDAALPTLEALRGTMLDVGYAAHLACWMLDRQGPDAALPTLERSVQRWRKALSLSNEHSATLTRILQQRVLAHSWSGSSIAQRKRLLASTDFDQTRAVLGALREAQEIDAQAEVLANDGIGVAPAPLLTGNDLIAHGLHPGPRFKQLLDAVYDAQLEGAVRDTPGAIAYVLGLVTR